MASKHIPDLATLRQLLKCYPRSGRLFWLKRPRKFFTSDRIYKAWNSQYAGTEAFTTINAGGYRVSAIFDEKFYGHRVVFAFAHGRWPDGEIDHIDGDRTNNRIENLREVSSVDNKRNAKMRCNNKSGWPGVGWRPEGRRHWRACIGVGGGTVHLGCFYSFEEAVAARKAAEIKYNFHANHGRAA